MLEWSQTEWTLLGIFVLLFYIGMKLETIERLLKKKNDD